MNNATDSGWVRKSHDIGKLGAAGQMNVPLAQEVTLTQPEDFAAERELGESPIKSAREPVSMAGSPARRAEHLVVINDQGEDGEQIVNISGPPLIHDRNIYEIQPPRQATGHNDKRVVQINHRGNNVMISSANVSSMENTSTHSYERAKGSTELAPTESASNVAIAIKEGGTVHLMETNQSTRRTKVQQPENIKESYSDPDLNLHTQSAPVQSGTLTLEHNESAPSL